MLADWYFCCCIKASPSATEAFLSILETLENPESDRQLLHLACDELRRTDLWMQVYALPAVLKLLDHPNFREGELDPIITQYVEGLSENVPDKVRNPLEQLTDEVVKSKGSAPRSIIKSLKECARKIPSHASSETVTPYLDLREFLAETMVLAFMAHQSKDSEFARAVADELDTEDSEITSLLEKSLDNKLGRLAFRLGVSISRLTGFQSSSDLCTAIEGISSPQEGTPSPVAELEPDLLHAYAEVLFGDSTTVGPIIHESLALTELRQLKRRGRNRRNEDSDSAFRRLGLDPNPYGRINLPIIYWQCILWELAAGIDPVATAQELGKFWQPPRNVPAENSISIGGPLAINECQEWKQQLISLIRVRGERVHIEVERQNDFSLPDEYKWLFGSPWIKRRDGGRTALGRDQRRYPMAEKPENLIRLIVGLCVSIRLLQARNNARRVEFCKLIAHASDAIHETYGKWLKNYNKDKKERPGITEQPLPLTGLALFGKRQIQQAGTGHLESIAPESFVQILRDNSDRGDNGSGGNDPEFLKSVLPNVLMSWIADAYPSAVGQSPSAGWLKLIREIYCDYYQQGIGYGFLDRGETAVVMRFLCPDNVGFEKEFDWRTARDKQGPMQWRVHHWQLLLTNRDLPPNEWEKPDWPETEDQPSQASRLVRALERLASLKHYRENEIPEDKQQWRREWKEYLQKIGKPEELYRFTRLRLIELLKDDQIPWESPDDQKIIAYVLLEYGCVYDLDKLISWVYFTNAGGNPVQVQAPTELQQTLLLAMFKFLERNALKLDREENQRSARDPKSTRIEFQKAELYKATICKVISTLENLSETVKQIRDRFFEGQSDMATARVKHCEVELRGTNKYILQPSNGQIADWSIRAAVYDPNRFTTTLFYDDFDLTGIHNLFDKSADEITSLTQNGASLNVLAVAVQVKQLENNGVWYTFNCGFSDYLCYTPTESAWEQRKCNEGDWVKLRIRQNPEQGQEWVVDPGEGSIRPLQRKLRVGDIHSFSICEYWEERTQRRVLKLKRGTEILSTEMSTEKIDWDLWDADVSRCFRQFPQPENRPVFAKCAQLDKWEPVDLDLSDLLLNAFNNRTQAVLTFIGEAKGQLGEKAWRFSTRPGENYVLERKQFKDAEALETELAELANLDNPHGLLISVNPVLENDTVRLALVSSEERPFDRRNIEWRELFSHSDSYVAEKRNEKWYVMVDGQSPSGYPRNIEVTWTEHRPQDDETTAEFILSQWDERTAQVWGQVLPHYKLELPPEETWQGFIDRWFNLKKGDRVDLASLVGTGRPSSTGRGFVTCRTPENLIVQVEAESLSLRLGFDSNHFSGRIQRKAEVISVKWTGWQRLNLNRDILPEAVQNDKWEGLLISVPGRKGGNLYEVVWNTGDPQTNPRQILIDSREKISQGCKLIAERNGEDWDFHIKSPYILVRALWHKPTEQTEYQPGQQTELHYLGTVSYGGNPRALAESETGNLVLLRQEPQNANHLAFGVATGDEINFEERLKLSDCRHWKPFDGNSWREGELYYRRAVLTLQNNRVLTGYCRANMQGNGKLTLDRVQLTLSDKGNDLWELRREFKLKQVREIQPRNREQETAAVWQQRLAEYLNAPRDLDASFDKPSDTDPKVQLYIRGGRDDIKVFDSDTQEWTYWVPLAPEEGAFVAANRYDREATVRLFTASSNKIMASFRQVPPLTIERFVAELGNPEWNKKVDLGETHLYYVGPEDADRITRERHQETHHRFELGYGKTLLIPESKLRFKGGKFGQAQLVLFHGDKITAIKFLREQIEGATGYIMDIVAFQWSDGHSLYEQREKYKIVHMVNIRISENRVKIESIEGFEDRNERETRSFTRVRAELATESKTRLLSRPPEGTDSSDRQYVIFGRLDTETYKRTNGEEVIFEHVRFSFQAGPDGTSPLQNGEMVFLQVRGITPVGQNDIGLQLIPPDSLTQSELSEINIGADMESILLLRRRFSLREDLLNRIYADEGANTDLIGKILLVSLTQEDRNRPSASLMRNRPARKSSALGWAVDSTSELALAVVVKVFDTEVELEWKPGIFFTLRQPDEIIDIPDNLTPGTSVRIEKIPKSYKFRITIAAFGDSRYVPREGTRPAVILPKNNLFDSISWEDDAVNNDSYWQQNKLMSSFTIGGLPNIQASPASYAPAHSAWGSPRASDFVKLMETKHPKIVCLGKDNQKRDVIAPLTDDFAAGRLEISKESLTVKYAPLAQDGSEGDEEISWLQLSFGDEPAQKIIARAKREQWSYHDTNTQYWSAEQQRFLTEKLGQYSVQDGPLFFDASKRLRYKKDQFLRFGFPVDELIASLKQQKEKNYPVAGISDIGGLWVELAPGRIVELPAQLVVWQSRAGEKSLANLDWELFAPGDRIKLQLVRSNPFDIERLALKDWIPGPRKAFGPNRCFLPVREDSCRGAIKLGHGQFTLTLPVTDPVECGKTAVLTPDNRLVDINALPSTERQPQPGDVVLLSVREDGTPIVLGLDELNPYPPASEALGPKDQLRNQLIELLHAIDGALPVTVERVEANGDFYFSLRHQSPAAKLRAGRVSVARVAGLLPDGRTVLLRCGGGLITMRIDQIVSGLPEPLFKTVARELKQSRALIWLRCDREATLDVGLKDESSREIWVEALTAVSDDPSQTHSQTQTGLICRSVDSMALYWVPSNKAALTALSLDELKDIFVSKDKRAFKVKLKAETGGSASVVEVPEVSQQFQNLKIGEELTVKVISRPCGTNNQGTKRYLVESMTAKVILECENYDGDILDRQGQPNEILVEVVRRIAGEQKSITVVPAGKKRQSLDLPKWWMTGPWPNPGDKNEPFANANYLRCITQDRHNRPGADEAQNLDRLLCYAYYNDACNDSGDAAKAWVAENYSKPEINVAYALMAILLLHKNGNTDLARYMTLNLGRRAFRSVHVEVLYQNWLNNKYNREKSKGLWERLKQIDQYWRDRQNVEQIIGPIQRFCEAVELRDQSEDEKKSILPIAAGLAAATGQVSNISVYCQEPLTKTLINLYRTLPLTRSGFQVPLLEWHIKKLQDQLERISHNLLDITLLDVLESGGKSTEPEPFSGPMNLLDLLKDGSEIESPPAEPEGAAPPQPDAGSTEILQQQLSLLRQFSEYCTLMEAKLKALQEGFERISNLLEE